MYIISLPLFFISKTKTLFSSDFSSIVYIAPVIFFLSNQNQLNLMEIIILPILVFVFVVIVIVLYNCLSTYKKKVDKSWDALQIQVNKQNNLPLDHKNNSLDSSVEIAQNEYNKIVARYNKIIQTFPTSIMAAMAGYDVRERDEHVKK